MAPVRKEPTPLPMPARASRTVRDRACFRTAASWTWTVRGDKHDAGAVGRSSPLVAHETAAAKAPHAEPRSPSPCRRAARGTAPLSRSPLRPQAMPLPPRSRRAGRALPGTIELESTPATRGAGCSACRDRAGARRARTADPAAARMAPGKHDARGAMNLIADIRFEVDGRPARMDPRSGRDLRLPHPAARRRAPGHRAFVYTSPLQTSEGADRDDAARCSTCSGKR